MTPKQKAKELFNKMYDFSIFEESAKKCALIAVDEIIKEINDNYDTLHSADRKQYWKGIKKEIKNL